MNKAILLLSLLTPLSVFASHPHQIICVVKGTTQAETAVQFLLQISSEREYVNGNPNEDVHDFQIQARVCDDDNDAGNCSTYAMAAPVHSLHEKVRLVGMKNPHKTLFEGVISEPAIQGELRDLDPQTSKPVMMPFKGSLTCISQTWVELKAEDDSIVH
jgi:hypothetical protein